MKRLFLFIYFSIIFSGFISAQSDATEIIFTNPFPSYSVSSTGVIEIRFSKDINEASLLNRIKIQTSDGNVLGIDYNYEEDLFFSFSYLYITPQSAFIEDHFYQLILLEGIEDVNGHLVDLNQDGTYGGDYSVLFHVHDESLDEFIFSRISDAIDDELNKNHYSMDSFDPWNIVLQDLDVILENANSREIELINNSEIFEENILNELKKIDEVIINNNLYYNCQVGNSEYTVITDDTFNLIETNPDDIELIYKARFYFEKKNSSVDLIYLDELQTVLRKVEFLVLVQRLLKAIRDAGVVFLTSTPDEQWAAVAKSMIESYVADFPEIYTRLFIGKKFDQFNNEIAIINELIAFNDVPFNSYEHTARVFYADKYLNNDVHSLLKLINDIWDKDGNLINQMNDVLETASSSLLENKNHLLRELESIRNLFNEILDYSYLKDELLKNETVFVNYNHSISEDKANLNSLLSTGYHNFEINIAIVNLVLKNQITRPEITNSNNVIYTLSPELTFTSFSSNIGTFQAGYQIEVFNDINSEEPIYNTGVILNNSSSVHTYGSLILEGYDDISLSERKSEILQFEESYSCRVRYYDTEGNFSEWSNKFNFTIAPKVDIYNIEFISPNLSTYNRDQIIDIHWTSNLPEETTYSINLFKDDIFYSSISPSIVGNKINWKVPSDQEPGLNYSIEIASLEDPDIKSNSIYFEIKQASSDYDIAIVEFELRDTYYQPNSNIQFDYKIRNSGVENASNFIVRYILRDANTDEILTTENELISDVITPLNQISKSGTLIAPNSIGFYNLEIILDYNLDYKLGNNSSILKVYVGHNNPYITYLRGVSDSDINIGENQTIGGYLIRVTAADANKVRIKIDDDEEFFDLKLNELSLLKNNQIGLIYKFYDGSSVILRSYTPTNNLSFSPVRFTAQAGKTTEVNYTIVDDDPKQSVSFFEEANELVDQQEVIDSWGISSQVTSSLFNEGKVLIDVPEFTERKLFPFWISIDGSRYIQKLEAEVINPIPDFEPIISRNKITTAPGRSNQLSISANALDGFSETILVSLTNVPEGVSITFLNSIKEFIPDESIQIQIAVLPDFVSFGTYNIDVNLSSDTKFKQEKLILNIVDETKNFLDISNVEYIDSDEIINELKIDFNSEFSYTSQSTSSSWQYLNGVDWINISSDEIIGNDPYIQGLNSIQWNIPPSMYIPDSKFRMKNKNGEDFLTETGRITRFDNDQTLSGITVKDDIVYVMDRRTMHMYLIEDGSYLGSKSISSTVSTDIDNKLFNVYGFFYILDNGSDRIYKLSENTNSFDYISHYSFLEDEECLIKINGELNIFFKDGTLGILKLIKLNEDLIKGEEIPLEYSNELVNPTSAIHVNDTIYATNNGRIWSKIGPNNLFAGNITGTRGMSFTYYNDYIYGTNEVDDINIFSGYNPYSFYSESEEFEINTTYKPKFIGSSNILNLIEDQNDVTYIFGDLFSDTDTPISGLNFEFVQISNGLEIEYIDESSLFTLSVKENIYGEESFRILVSDGINSLFQDFIVNIEPVDDDTMPGPKINQTITINEDEEIIISFDNLFLDVDNEAAELNISCNAFIRNTPEVPAGFAPTIHLENEYILFKPNPNQYGEFLINLTIENPIENKSETYSFILNVLAINDKPDSFSLLSPINKRFLPGEISFNWENSSDIENDNIEYNFIVSSENFQDSELTLNNSTTYNFDSTFIGKTIYWHVVASDGIDQTYPTNHYGVIQIVEEKSDLYPFDQIIKDELVFRVKESDSINYVFNNLLKFTPLDINQLSFSLDPILNFNIKSNGDLFVNSNLDYETVNSYNVSFLINYNDDPEISYSNNLNILVDDVNEAPYFNDVMFSINENSINDLLVGQIIATDPESNPIIFNIKSGNETGAFKINHSTGEILVSDSTQIDFEINQSFELIIEVSDGVLSYEGIANINIDDILENDDSDNDGVSDQNDNCPGTPEGTGVDVHGCPIDNSIVLQILPNQYLDFGQVLINDNKEKYIQLINIGNVDIEISSITITGSTSSFFTIENTLPNVLPVGNSFDLVISCLPNNVGVFDATLDIYNNSDNLSPIKSIILSGLCYNNDSDNDGIPDLIDNCPFLNNPYQSDIDNDGIGDNCDDDIDGDGILNENDNCPEINNVNQEDQDGDGIGDVCDDDIDGDGIENSYDNCPVTQNFDQSDLDNDGLGDVCDNDIDGDGLINENDLCPYKLNTDQSDLDNDGIGNVCDNDIDGDGILNENDNCILVANHNQSDIDNDGIGNVCDNDIDGDGIENGIDNCPEVNNVNQEDQDGDGIGDICDDDIDGDGILNENDNCPLRVNTNQNDLDNDGIGDVCDDDIDGDGILNENDNCPEVNNIDQSDIDGDNIGDVCDNDIDGDGILDENDNCPDVSNVNQEDLDGDGVGDICDDDIDGDGILNENDNCPITTNINQDDIDNDSIGDACDNDIDGDGVLNENDRCPETENGAWVFPNGCSVEQSLEYKFNPNVSYSSTTDYNGNVYKTVQIGNQIWMAENLRSSRYVNGDYITYENLNYDWSHNNIPMYTYYNVSENYQRVYGNLYNWYAANDSRNICPEGWHVPSVSELEILFSYLGGTYYAGGKLKEEGVIHWSIPNGEASNSSGFTSIPSGSRDYLYGRFSNSSDLLIWSSDEMNLREAYGYSLNSSDGRVRDSEYRKRTGMCVRCVKDNNGGDQDGDGIYDEFDICPDTPTGNIVNSFGCSLIETDIKVYLQGPSLNPIVGEETLMRDNLKSSSSIPLISPYQDELAINPEILNTTGNNAIVDWVFVELRDENDSKNIITSRSALLQRDGDIVDLDGVSSLVLEATKGNFFISIKHRNHLAIISSSPISLESINNQIDFTNNLSFTQGEGNALLNTDSGYLSMIAGDYDGNGQVQNTDLITMIQLLGGAGYSNADLDLNGQIQNTDVGNILNKNIGKGLQFEDEVSGKITNKAKANESVHYSFENAKMTFENGKNYYEVDIYIKSTQNFKLHSGQLYINYNSLAFGNNVVENNKVEYSQPENSILGTRYSSIPIYKSFIKNDHSSSKLSLSYHLALKPMNHNINEISKKLFHLKIEFKDPSQEPSICFENNSVFSEQTYVISNNDENKIINLGNDTFDCEGALLFKEEISIPDNIIVYPNPTSRKIFIKGLKEKSNIKIFDLTGKLIFEKRKYLDGKINVSRLNNGLYIIKIENSKESVVKKLVLNNNKP